MRSTLVPVLEESSGKKCGVDFGVCYNPLFIALGSILRDLLTPDVLLVGESDPRAGDVVAGFLTKFVTNGAVPQRMSFENAELSKIAVNTFVTTKITFANMLAALCDRLPGGDVDTVSNAVGLDRRIGRKYLTGGLGYGGPCFPRDNLAMKHFSDATGVDASLPSTVDALNRMLPAAIAKRLGPIVRDCVKVAVLGLSYKPQSNWAEESQGVFLANSISEMGPKVSGFDPLANAMARPLLNAAVEIAGSIEDCIRGADLVLVTTPDDAFGALNATGFGGGREPVVVVDFWRRLDHLDGAPNILYLPYGRASQSKWESASFRFSRNSV
jgi:UDPglucose 6-dehydrogenase